MRLITYAVLLSSLALCACSDETDSEATTDAGVGGEPDAQTQTALCNGHEELCARAYDDVSFAATHNANAAQEYGYGINSNQISGLTKQLQGGVRALLLDVTYDDAGATVLCHGPCSLASTPHLDGLAELKTFMDEHPREVVTIIYQDSISEEDLEADFETSGLFDLVYTLGGSWPTLETMIEDGTRLVVTTESGSAPPAWIHHVWDVAFDTPYSFMSVDEFSCELNRGAADNDLFLMNHWVNTELDLPSEENAQLVNASDVLLTRAQACEAEAGKRPNFVAVDFYEHGDLFEVVDTLNGL